MEKILQIRNLYTYNNGMADEKFIKYFPEFNLNETHGISIDTMLDYLSKAVAQIDKASVQKFNLARSL